MTERKLTPQEKVTNEWDQMAGEWDDLAGGYAAGLNKLLWNRIESDESTVAEWSVLDFGCGTGLLTDLLRPKVKKIVAMDVSSQMIRLLEDKIICQEWSNTQAIHCALASLTDESRQVVESLYGTMDMIVASSVLNFIPEDDVSVTMEMLGKFLKPGGMLVHSDWPKSEAKHPDAMDDAKASFMYEKAGLSAISTEILILEAGGGETMEVFFGVARKE